MNDTRGIDDPQHSVVLLIFKVIQSLKIGDYGTPQLSYVEQIYYMMSLFLDMMSIVLYVMSFLLYLVMIYHYMLCIFHYMMCICYYTL